MMTKILGTLIAVLLAILASGWFYLSILQTDMEELSKSITYYKIEIATMSNTITSQSKLCEQRVNIVKIQSHTEEELEEVFVDKKSFKFTASEETGVYTIEAGSNTLTLSRVSPANTQCLYDGNGWIWVDSEVLR